MSCIKWVAFWICNSNNLYLFLKTWSPKVNITQTQLLIQSVHVLNFLCLIAHLSEAVRLLTFSYTNDPSSKTTWTKWMHFCVKYASIRLRGLCGRVVMRLALKLLAPLRWCSNPMRGSCHMLTGGCWFTLRNNFFLQLWKLNVIYNQTWVKNGVKHQFTSQSPHLH